MIGPIIGLIGSLFGIIQSIVEHNKFALMGWILSLCWCALYLFSMNYSVKTYLIKERALKEKAAEYNKETGEFQWLDENLKFIVTGEK